MSFGYAITKNKTAIRTLVIRQSSWSGRPPGPCLQAVQARKIIQLPLTFSLFPQRHRKSIIFRHHLELVTLSVFHLYTIFINLLIELITKVLEDCLKLRIQCFKIKRRNEIFLGCYFILKAKDIAGIRNFSQSDFTAAYHQKGSWHAPVIDCFLLAKTPCLLWSIVTARQAKYGR